MIWFALNYRELSCLVELFCIFERLLYCMSFSHEKYRMYGKTFLFLWVSANLIWPRTLRLCHMAWHFVIEWYLWIGLSIKPFDEGARFAQGGKNDSFSCYPSKSQIPWGPSRCPIKYGQALCPLTYMCLYMLFVYYVYEIYVHV